MTLKDIVESTLQNSGLNFKLNENENANAKNNDNAIKFIVECDSVNLHGTVTNEKYKWQIKKNDGVIVDESECSIKNTDDVINRIYETIRTGNRISKYVNACNEARKDYFKPDFIKEEDETYPQKDTSDDKETTTTSKRQILLSNEDEFVDVDTDTDVEVETEEFDVQTALDDIIQRSVELASDLIGVIDALPEDDIENKEDLIGLAGNFYGMADDIDDVIDELYPEDELDEGCHKKITKKKSLTDNKKIINKISEASILMRNNPNYKEIREALKLIKSELVLRK